MIKNKYCRNIFFECRCFLFQTHADFFSIAQTCFCIISEWWRIPENVCIVNGDEQFCTIKNHFCHNADPASHISTFAHLEKLSPDNSRNVIGLNFWVPWFWESWYWIGCEDQFEYKTNNKIYRSSGCAQLALAEVNQLLCHCPMSSRISHHP